MGSESEDNDEDAEEVLSDEEVEMRVDTAKEVAEFDEKESDHDLIFSSEDYERLGCFSHTLQLVVSKFDDVKPCKDALFKAKKLVAKVNKSVKATEMLKKLSKVKLRGDCPTRWSSTFLLLERLVEVKVHLEKVLKKMRLDGLQLHQWKVIENVVDLLRPFAEYTDLCGGENYTTISTVIPVLMELSLHLDKVISTIID